ncbi:hypothetical protein ACFE04_016551 [Oxalis oulophora]
MTSSSSSTITVDDQSLELIVCDAPPLSSLNTASVATDSSDDDDITPLLTQSTTPIIKPKINIFSVSHSPRSPTEHLLKLLEPETSLVARIISFLWSGSSRSGLLCMLSSSTIYFIMELISTVFYVNPFFSSFYMPAQSIPLFETAMARCTIISILSYFWLRKGGQPIFGTQNARSLLLLRALMGSLSLLTFVYGIQMLPLSQAIVLSLTTPIMASFAARIILHENLGISDFGGKSTKAEVTDTLIGIDHVYAVLIGLVSSVTGGISYCLIKAGAKASDNPVVPVFSFGVLATFATGICAFAFEEFVIPDLWSFSLVLLLGVLAFFAEVFLARGLQLEKTSKVANIQYIEVVLSQLWSISVSGIAPSFGLIIGSLLIIISVCSTVYMGPDKEME